ncbi:GL24288 [Drosophila persimilis]|uniref:Protein Turandot M-like n=2 Tax=pseudoobscura subgroup TaxID=32358 RepID=A0A6I8V2P0_DROPS|nr:protein Turandot M [Drosophila persimilis]XP_002137420.1 protein Turandot M [Drosophila pseudoobscura]EDW24699.1 GL24288 [Drosophila persimilis]
MANAIRLVSLMAVLACLVSIGCAQHDEEEKRRLVYIYTNPDVDQATKETNLGSLAKFYEDHSNSLQLPEDQKQRNDELLEKHKRINSSEVLIDGVPANGGWKSSLLRHIVVEGAIQAVGAAVEHARSSSKGLEINREVAIFGLVFLVASYMFRTKSM